MKILTENDKKRVYLDNWTGPNKVTQINHDYPNCACESASDSPIGFGKVVNSEKLRYLACSTSDIKQKSVCNFRITHAIFKRIFTSGVSVVRINHTSRKELNLTAKILYNYHNAKSGEAGGVVGVVDFSAKQVRVLDRYSNQICCVFETPLSERPSHADIICNQNNLSNFEKNGLMIDLFNQIGGENTFKIFQKINDFDISDYIPQKYNT